MGYGKSATGNTILNGTFFTEGEDVRAVTTELKSASKNGITIIDCPGFCDPRDATIFHKEFLKNREFILNGFVPLHGFLFLVKFDNDQTSAFIKAAQKFVKSFGSKGVKSLVLICIQSNPKRRYSEADLRKILTESVGYKFLLGKNKNLIKMKSSGFELINLI